jgi:hypothetical protein
MANGVSKWIGARPRRRSAEPMQIGERNRPSGCHTNRQANARIGRAATDFTRPRRETDRGPGETQRAARRVSAAAAAGRYQSSAIPLILHGSLTGEVTLATVGRWRLRSRTVSMWLPRRVVERRPPRTRFPSIRRPIRRSVLVVRCRRDPASLGWRALGRHVTIPGIPAVGAAQRFRDRGRVRLNGAE